VPEDFSEQRANLFAPSEAADFAEFLEGEVDENYFVVEDEARSSSAVAVCF
jgi:hypothetical protein